MFHIPIAFARTTIESLRHSIHNVVCSLASAPAAPAPIGALASEHTTGGKNRLPTFTLTFALILFSAQGTAADTLESQNPFLPPGYGEAKPEAPKPVVQTNGPISREVEFRGVVQLDGNYQFSVFNKSENKGYWLQENQSEGGIAVRGYDADSKTITVNMNGRSERLTLMSSTGAPLPVVASVNQATQPKANTPNLPPGLQNSTNNQADNRRRVIPRRRVILPKK